MNKRAFATFSTLRSELKERIAAWTKAHPYLPALQEELRLDCGYQDYQVETPLVYNRALDEVEAGDHIALILAADNPGKKEQLRENLRYLVGQSGKLAEGFFRRELDLDFRSEVLIINKTPIHTPKTHELRRLLALAGPIGSERRRDLEGLLRETQEEMARFARTLQGALGLPLWISGYGELGPRGLFRYYAEGLRKAYASAPPRLREKVWLFRHFSMNQFAIELKDRRDPSRPLLEELARIGGENRRRILGF